MAELLTPVRAVVTFLEEDTGDRPLSIPVGTTTIQAHTITTRSVILANST